MKYKVGDKVRVRPDLVRDKDYCMEHDKTIKDCVIGEMLSWAGEIVTIESIVNGKYFIKEDFNYWTDGMFEGLVNSITFHEYDTVKHGIYGIGTVISKRKNRNGTVLVDFDEWNPDFSTKTNECYITPDELTLVKAYVEGDE